MRLGLVALALGFSACAPADETTPAERATDVERWMLEEVRRIGGLDGAVQLTAIQDLVATPSGLYFTEAAPARVAKWVPGEEGLTEIGGVGDGPGEYRIPTSIQMIGDTLWVADARTTRALGYVDDEPVARHRLEAREGFSLAFPIGFLRDGTFVLETGVRLEPVLEGEQQRAFVMLAGRDGEEPDTLHAWSYPREDYYRWPRDSRFAYAGLPIQQNTLVAVLEDGSGVAVLDREPARADTASSYEVTVFGPDGAARTVTTVSYEPAPSGPRVDAYVERRRAELESGDASPAEISTRMKALREAFDVVPFEPPVTSMTTSSGGELWLQRESLGRDSVRWDVVDLDASTRVGYVTLPAGTRVLDARRNGLWAVRTDELDVPEIVEYRIERNPDPPSRLPPT